MDLSNSHVVITGASRGIGAEMARQFAAAGARLSVVARSEDPLRELADSVGGRAFVADLADPATVDGLIDRITSESGDIDVLVNNAGIEQAEWFHDTDPALIRDIYRLNLEAPALLTRRVLPQMIERDRGWIVLVSSLASTAGFPSTSVYSSSKAGLSTLGNAIRAELKNTNVGLTVVSPGAVDNPMWQRLVDADGADRVVRRLNRLQLVPTTTEDYIASHTVDAVTGGRRHVRTPRRLAANHWMRELPQRVIEKVLIGVPVGPTAKD